MLAGPATDPNRFTRDLFTGLPDRYDMLAEVLSLGQNRRWRRAMVDHIVPAAPVRILDVASGRKQTWAEPWGLHNALVLFNPGPIT